MKAAKMLMGLAMVFALAVVVSARAEDKKDDKEVTLKGELQCGKCTLGICKKCTNAIVVKDGDKELVYLLDDEGGKAPYHKGICPPNTKKAASVTGTITEKPSGDKPGKIKPAKDGVKLD